ncbi:putative Phage baseplate assembly protein [uncultured Alphaproteobacteria bacterium]|uniref:Putative Phage baseplate assembly protein n=1 Tax=uncultured Alphaproteobacteria bacterium TaxID=91750 RepID=A0A212J3Z5_9PROT|nr:putative Phage baseplate assembly protein [uncultured Alphaproteobacteria bacterium]
MSLAQSEISRLLDNVIQFGTIAEVDDANRRVRLVLSGRRTGWLPYPCEIGQNFRRWRPLRVGTQVVAGCPSGNPANAVILQILYTDALPPPSTDSAVDLIQWNDGSRVKYDSAAKRMEVVSVGDLAATSTKDLTANAGGNLTATAGGNAAIAAGAVASITAPAITLNATRGGKGAATMNGSFRLKGDFEIEGDVAVTGNIDATGSILAGGENSNHHSHP